MKSLLLVFLSLVCSGCAPKKLDIEIPFVVLFNGEAIDCTAPVDKTWLTDLRFYVSDLKLIGPDGQETPIELITDDVWQTESVAVLDFENGQGACVNGTARINQVIRGRFRAADVAGLRFRIGVPEDLNHADLLSAAAPLNYTDMHWHWAAGYKFLRAGVETEDDSFWMHLGSSRCAGTVGNIQGCRSGNRPSVSLREFVPGTHRVTLDLAALFADIDLDDTRRTDCSSGPAETTCAAPFSALGLNVENGESIESVGAFSIDHGQ